MFVLRNKKFLTPIKSLAVASVLFLGVLPGLAAAQEVWNSNDWGLYDTITIDHTVIDEDLTDFPVYVDLADLSSQFWSTTPSGTTTAGTDIRVTTEGGIELPRELVSASATAQTGELHFKAPTISSTTDTVFRIYYNGTTTGDYARTDTYGSENVWTNDYMGVWHLGEDPTNTIFDSTENEHDGTSAGAAVASSGQMGQATDFDSSATSYNMGDNLKPDEVTVSVWHNSPVAGNTFGRLVSSRSGTNGYVLDIESNGEAGFLVGNGTSLGFVIPEYEDTWVYQVGTFDGSVARLFTSGVERATSTASMTYSADDVFIGGELGGLSGTFFDGQIDEVRIASTSRSDAWISAEYTNQSTTTDFYAMEIGVTEWNPATFILYDTITIDHTVIDEDLTDFPVYVDLADLSSQFWLIVSSDGEDIRVTTDTNVEVPREIVSASTTLETGELHFKAPTISSTTDTTFRIWYNGSASGYDRLATYGSQNVWTNGYVGVWHLQEDPSGGVGAIVDSTSYNNNATSSGSMTAVDLVSSQLGEGYDLDGTDDYLSVQGTSDFDFTSSDYSINMWAKLDTVQSNWAGLLVKGDVANDFGYQRNSGSANMYTYHGGFAVNWSNYWDTITNDSWVAIATSYDVSESELELYRDGVGVATSYATAPSYNAPSPINIGATRDLITVDGQIDEVRIASTSRSDAWISAEYTNQSTTTDFYATGPPMGSSIVLGTHTEAQTPNTLGVTAQNDEVLYRFALQPVGSTSIGVSEISIVLSEMVLLEASDFSDIRLFRDHNANGVYDVTDEQVGGFGAATDTGSNTATLTFSAEFLATTTVQYIVVADWTKPVPGASALFSLSAVDITPVFVPVVTTGSTESVLHFRKDRRSGGGSSLAIVNIVVAGNGAVGGGVDDGGELIGNDPDYLQPSFSTGFWVNPANAYDGVDGTYATDNTGVTNNFTSYNFVVKEGNAIEGIEVRLEVSATTVAGNLSAELSWDGGSSWTESKTTSTLTTSDVVAILGSLSDTWGRSWNASEFSDANFVLRLTGGPSGNTIQVDEIQVRVYHQVTGGSSGGGGAI